MTCSKQRKWQVRFVSDLHEDLVVALAVGIKAVHQLLPAGPHQVLGQGQVPDGCVCGLIQVQAALVPQLPRDLGTGVLQASHSIYQAEGKVLLQPQNGGVVCLHTRGQPQHKSSKNGTDGCKQPRHLHEPDSAMNILPSQQKEKNPHSVFGRVQCSHSMLKRESGYCSPDQANTGKSAQHTCDITHLRSHTAHTVVSEV